MLILKGGMLEERRVLLLEGVMTMNTAGKMMDVKSLKDAVAFAMKSTMKDLKDLTKISLSGWSTDKVKK